MQEIRLRIDAINTGTKGDLSSIRPEAVREFCYLQIRYICELVSLGCLVAHNDITPVNNMSSQYRADKILNKLVLPARQFLSEAIPAGHCRYGNVYAGTQAWADD